MTHDEWLEERRHGIGGSDAGAVVGMSRYKSAFEVYADKLGLVPPKEDNEAMRQGRDLEEYVARRFCEVTGKKVRRHRRTIYNAQYSFALANVDRLVSGECAGLECKTASALNERRFKHGNYPEEYYCQCMHYMAVTGLKKWYLAVLILGKEFKIYEIERDEDEISALMELERVFWEEYVQKQTPPPVSGSDGDMRAISAMYPEADGSQIELVGFNNILKRRSEVRELIKKLQAETDEIENRIKLYMGAAEVAENNSYRVTWKNYARKKLDIKELCDDYKIDNIDDYYIDSKYRKFNVKELENE